MSRAEHPLIAINGEMELGKSAPKLVLGNRYADSVLRAGGIPIAIPPVGGPRDIENLLENVDGLILSGGDDLDLERLGRGANHPAIHTILAAKQDFDVELARAALERDLPVLGICLGMQLLGVLGGSRLFQHLPEDRPGSREHRGYVEHSVSIAKGSRLARILECESLAVSSSHHQALASVEAPWIATAHDDEGLIEAIEHPRAYFAIAVQWHPERSPEGSAHDRLFRALVGAAGVAAARSLYGAPVATRRS